MSSATDNILDSLFAQRDALRAEVAEARAELAEGKELMRVWREKGLAYVQTLERALAEARGLLERRAGCRCGCGTGEHEPVEAWETDVRAFLARDREASPKEPSPPAPPCRCAIYAEGLVHEHAPDCPARAAPEPAPRCTCPANGSKTAAHAPNCPARGEDPSDYLHRPR